MTAPEIPAEPVRVKVACINWSHPTAPHAIVYLTGGEFAERVPSVFVDNHANAITYADGLATRLRAQLRAAAGATR